MVDSTSKEYLELLLSDAKAIKKTLQSNEQRLLDVDIRARSNEVRLRIILSCIPPIAILGLNILCENSMASNIIKTMSEFLK